MEARGAQPFAFARILIVVEMVIMRNEMRPETWKGIMDSETQILTK